MNLKSWSYYLAAKLISNSKINYVFIYFSGEEVKKIKQNLDTKVEPEPESNALKQKEKTCHKLSNLLFKKSKQLSANLDTPTVIQNYLLSN